MPQKKPANKTRAKVNKVVKGLKKASKTHARQAKTLQSLKLKKVVQLRKKVKVKLTKQETIQSPV